MSNPEHPSQRLRPCEVFSLTAGEQLHYRVSDSRFQPTGLSCGQTLVAHPDVVIHEITLDSNAFGEYLFVTVSREREGQRYAMTFYGLGYHQPRERWITDKWYWYENNPIDRVYRQTLNKPDAYCQIQARRLEIADHSTDAERSHQALLLALFADGEEERRALPDWENLASLGWLYDGEED